MVGSLTFTARTVPECENFLKIKWVDEEYTTIDKFIKAHAAASKEELYSCNVCYRGREKTYREFLDEYVAFSEKLQLLRIDSLNLITSPRIKAAWYFINKAADCLQNARFFTVKSNLLLDPQDNIPWSHGYIPQFSLRCTYFGTATTWYSNTFDQLLQAVYWAFELYTNAKDLDNNPYDDTWDVKEIMTSCTYKFVVQELKNRGYTNVRKLLTSCSEKIKVVRNWANYIKHKGGIEYKYLEPEDPFMIYIMPAGETASESCMPDERFAIKNFKSPIEIDIDEKIEVLKNSHTALHDCITETIALIDFDKYQLSFGE